MKTKTATVEPGQWARFLGWDPELIHDAPTLSADFLDANFSSSVPLAVLGQSLHVAWVNSLGLEKLGIDENTVNPTGGTIVKDTYGKPTGQLLESAVVPLFSPSPDQGVDELYESCKTQWRHYASVGLTTVTDLAYTPAEMRDMALMKIASDEDCPVRVGM